MSRLTIEIAIILSLVFFAAGDTFANDKNVLSVSLNGETLKEAAYTEEGVMYFPLRAVSEAMDSGMVGQGSVRNTDKSGR